MTKPKPRERPVSRSITTCGRSGQSKLVLAAEQVRTVHQAYRPTEPELARARAQIARMQELTAANEGAGMADGEFLDPVVIAPALATIARAEAPL